MGTGRQAYSRLTDDKRVIYYHQLPASTLSALLLRFAFSAASDGLEPPSSLKHHFQDFLVDNSGDQKIFQRTSLQHSSNLKYRTFSEQVLFFFER